MVRTILSNAGYKCRKADLTLQELQSIKEDLTVKPFVPKGFAKPVPSFKLFMESPNSLYLPRHYGYQRFQDPTENRLHAGHPITVRFKGSLRPEQQPIEDLYLKSARSCGGGLISLKCGGGKTVLALHILTLLKVKTLVVVHKDFLMTQWRDRITEFVPKAKIGKIQQSTLDIEGADIVLAMVQSLSMKEYPPGTFDSFGLTIFDECHHLGAEVFHRSMAKVAGRYSLGLSATPNRKDGLRKVFEWYIGPMVYQTTDKNQDHIETRIYEYTSSDPAYCREELSYGKPCYPRMINNVCAFLPRQVVLQDLIRKEHALGRKILVLSDRRQYLDDTMAHLNATIHDQVAGLYVGGMKPHELRDSQGRDIILGTFSMASEGMDIPKLNTIVLASPKSDVIQSVGRILREKAATRQFHPLVIDLKDCHPNLGFFEKQCGKRITYYKQQNHEISLISVDGTISKIETKGQTKKAKSHVLEMAYLLD